MPGESTQSTVPSGWILAILALLCSFMLWCPEPADLAQLPWDARGSFSLQGKQEAHAMPMLPQPQWRGKTQLRQEKLSHNVTAHVFCKVQDVVVLPWLSVAFFLPFWIFSLPAPQVWHGRGHFSRAPPLLAP